MKTRRYVSTLMTPRNLSQGKSDIEAKTHFFFLCDAVEVDVEVAPQGHSEQGESDHSDSIQGDSEQGVFVQTYSI